MCKRYPFIGAQLYSIYGNNRKAQSSSTMVETPPAPQRWPEAA